MTEVNLKVGRGVLLDEVDKVFGNVVDTIKVFVDFIDDLSEEHGVLLFFWESLDF